MKLGTLYREFLEKDRIYHLLVKKPQIPEEGTSKGSYRHIIAHAMNNDVKFRRIFSRDEDKKYNHNETKNVAVNDAGSLSRRHNEDVNVQFKFQLPKGSYATMFLRELMLTTVVRDIDKEVVEKSVLLLQFGLGIEELQS
jgi:tRNA(Glu) U13 pseudouridine synthase TruD